MSVLNAIMLIRRVCVYRDIERRRTEDERAETPSWLSQQDNYYVKLVLLCVIVIVACCVVYVRSSWHAAAALRRVPTMSYYMLDEDISSLSSVNIHKSRSYSHFLSRDAVYSS